jgi:hypothetical protein
MHTYDERAVVSLGARQMHGTCTQSVMSLGLCVRCTHTTSPTGADLVTRRGCASDARSWMSGTQRRQNHASPARVRPDTPRRSAGSFGMCIWRKSGSRNQTEREICAPRVQKRCPGTLRPRLAAEGRLRPVGTTWRLLGLDEVAGGLRRTPVPRYRARPPRLRSLDRSALSLALRLALSLGLLGGIVR